MKRTCILMLLILGLSSSPLMAKSGWTDYGQILSLESDSFGNFLVQVNVSNNPSFCDEKQWFHANNKQLYQLLVEASSHDKRVRLRVTGYCHLKGYSQISKIGMEP